MTDSTSPRRVLQNLPVNSFGTPSTVNITTSSKIRLKRQIHDIEDPILPPASSRPRLADHNASLEPKVYQTSHAFNSVVMLTRSFYHRPSEERIQRNRPIEHRTKTEMNSLETAHRIAAKFLYLGRYTQMQKATRWTHNRRQQQKQAYQMVSRHYHTSPRTHTQAHCPLYSVADILSYAFITTQHESRKPDKSFRWRYVSDAILAAHEGPASPAAQ
ncbi:MAG: hypothetical protein Q9213_001746 [Squamulea squamosa]